MQRYRKKPVVVDAVQVLEGHGQEVEEFTGSTHLEWEMADPDPADRGKGFRLTGLLLWVEASKAVCRLDPGDWIIREQDGSGFYPCKADVFERTYDPAGGEAVSVDPADVRVLLDAMKGDGSDVPGTFGAWHRLHAALSGGAA